MLEYYGKNTQHYIMQQNVNLYHTYQWFPTRMVYLHEILCLRYTILVGNSWYTNPLIIVLYVMFI